MARIILILLFFLAFTSCADMGGGTQNQPPPPPPPPPATSVSLTWDASASPGVTGYKIYVGRSSGNYFRTDDARNVLTYTVRNLTPGTYYFTCTAYDASGNESYFSNEISTTL